jgi:hypothetical protein
VAAQVAAWQEGQEQGAALQLLALQVRHGLLLPALLVLLVLLVRLVLVLVLPLQALLLPVLQPPTAPQPWPPGPPAAPGAPLPAQRLALPAPPGPGPWRRAEAACCV